MEIAVVTRLLAKRDMDVNSAHLLVFSVPLFVIQFRKYENYAFLTPDFSEFNII